MGRFLAGVLLLSPLVGCNTDARFVCQRLAGCGCLDLNEGVDACAARIEDQSSRQIELCARCLEGHDYLCHELASNHAVCGGCTDLFASPGVVRDPEVTGKVGQEEADVFVTCILAPAESSEQAPDESL